MENQKRIQIGPSVRIKDIEKILEERKSEIKVSYGSNWKNFNPETDLVLSSIPKEKKQIEIDKELLDYFDQSEQKINRVLHQAMEFDKALHSETEYS